MLAVREALLGDGALQIELPGGERQRAQRHSGDQQRSGGAAARVGQCGHGVSPDIFRLGIHIVSRGVRIDMDQSCFAVSRCRDRRGLVSSGRSVSRAGGGRGWRREFQRTLSAPRAGINGAGLAQIAWPFAAPKCDGRLRWRGGLRLIPRRPHRPLRPVAPSPQPFPPRRTGPHPRPRGGWRRICERSPCIRPAGRCRRPHRPRPGYGAGPP